MRTTSSSWLISKLLCVDVNGSKFGLFVVVFDIVGVIVFEESMSEVESVFFGVVGTDVVGIAVVGIDVVSIADVGIADVGIADVGALVVGVLVVGIDVEGIDFVGLVVVGVFSSLPSVSPEVVGLVETSDDDGVGDGVGDDVVGDNVVGDNVVGYNVVTSSMTYTLSINTWILLSSF